MRYTAAVHGENNGHLPREAVPPVPMTRRYYHEVYRWRVDLSGKVWTRTGKRQEYTITNSILAEIGIETDIRLG